MPLYNPISNSDLIQQGASNLYASRSVNKLNKSTMTYGGYLNHLNTLVASALWCYSDYIPVTNGKQYTVNDGISNMGCLLYNASKVFIDAIWVDATPAITQGQVRTFTITNANVAYIIVNFQLFKIPTGIVVEGSTSLPYQNYGAKYIDGIEMVNKNAVSTLQDSCRNQVIYGMNPSQMASLTSPIASGVAYINGKRIEKLTTSKLFTASKDTYMDLNYNEEYIYEEVENGGAEPTLAINSIRIAKVVTNATIITSVYVAEGNLFSGYSPSFIPIKPRYNAVFGYGALAECGGTQYATAMGYNALNKNKPDGTQDSGLYNTAFGYKALELNVVGNHNTAVGFCALQNNLAGNNTACGEDSLLSNTTGDSNAAVGVYGLKNNTSGRGNSAVGVNALANNTTGSWNVAMGEGSGISNFGGIGNCDADTSMTFIGALASVNKAAPENQFTNSTAIGFSAKVNKSNMVRLGNGDVTSVESYGDYETVGTAKGFICKSPDGTRYRSTVADGGTIAVTAA